jgi:hypothetical protein
MANTRIRLESDIEAYLKSQGERVMGIAPENLTTADLTTLTNRIIYEHKLARNLMQQEFIPRILNWVKNVLPSGGNKVIQMPTPQTARALPTNDDFDFAADLAAQFEQDVA